MAPLMREDPSIDGIADIDNHHESVVETVSPRKKIVIVGLGMVAISFMYVHFETSIRGGLT
jgi:nitrite reductase (NAD(P)H)